MSRFLIASDFFGPFSMDHVPCRPDQVPSLQDMRQGYGMGLPAIKAVSKYLPLKIRTAGANWQAVDVLGLAAVYWNGKRGRRHFHCPDAQGAMCAKWTSVEKPSDNCVVADVHEDPYFTNRLQVKTETLHCRIDPDDPPNMGEQADDNSAYHQYENTGSQTGFSASNAFRWWPIWLVCRTKGGWWSICWYQLIDGDWAVECWWYADAHVHLVESIH